MATSVAPWLSPNAALICPSRDVCTQSYNMSNLCELNRYQIYREVKLHSNLQHENIIQLFAAFKEGDQVRVQRCSLAGNLACAHACMCARAHMHRARACVSSHAAVASLHTSRLCVVCRRHEGEGLVLFICMKSYAYKRYCFMTMYANKHVNFDSTHACPVPHSVHTRWHRRKMQYIHSLPSQQVVLVQEFAESGDLFMLLHRYGGVILQSEGQHQSA